MIPNSNGIPGWDDPDKEDIVEEKVLGVEQLRWSRSVSELMSRRASVNRAFNEYTPIFMDIGPEVYEAKPNALYLALEQLPLEGASDEAIRACLHLREIVISEIVTETYRQIDIAMGEN